MNLEHFSYGSVFSLFFLDWSLIILSNCLETMSINTFCSTKSNSNEFNFRLATLLFQLKNIVSFEIKKYIFQIKSFTQNCDISNQFTRCCCAIITAGRCANRLRAPCNHLASDISRYQLYNLTKRYINQHTMRRN